MRWEYCENCPIDGHCENQDRGHECETYGKRIKDKCERLQKQLDIALKCLNVYANEDYWLYCCKACGGSYYNLHKDEINLKYGEYPARNALANIKDQER